MRHLGTFLLKWHSTLLGLIFLFFSLPTKTLATEERSGAPSVLTNLEVVQSGLADLAKEIISNSGVRPDFKITVRIQNSPDAWTVQNVFLETLKGLGYDVYLSSLPEGGKVVVLELGLFEAKVNYGKTFRESFLGKRKSQRAIKVTVSANLRSPEDEILFAGRLSRTFSDTVRAGNIGELENSQMPFTRGEPPTEGFFDTVVEPLILVGASAVAIYLFFTVRS